MEIDRCSIPRIEAMLVEDGYTAVLPRAREIRTAARTGALLWTKKRLTTSDKSQIDVRPE